MSFLMTVIGSISNGNFVSNAASAGLVLREALLGNTKTFKITSYGKG